MYNRLWNRWITTQHYYRYYLDRLETNSNTYLASHTIDADSQVLDLLK